MATKNCPNCGKELADIAVMCPECGYQYLHSPTKQCKYCKTDIAKDAKICPNCKKKQGGKGLWIALGIIAFIVIVGAFGEEETSETPNNNVSTVEHSETTKPQPTVEAEKEIVDPMAEKTFAIGEVAEYENVQMTVLGYEESNGGDWGAPTDGNVFIFPEIEIANNSNNEISVSSMISFESYCDDYKLDFSSAAMMFASTEKMQGIDGTIASGKKLKGYLYLEVPADWKTIEIYYKDNFWLGSNYKFVINK